MERRCSDCGYGRQCCACTCLERGAASPPRVSTRRTRQRLDPEFALPYSYYAPPAPVLSHSASGGEVQQNPYYTGGPAYTAEVRAEMTAIHGPEHERAEAAAARGPAFDPRVQAWSDNAAGVDCDGSDDEGDGGMADVPYRFDAPSEARRDVALPRFRGGGCPRPRV